MEISNNPNKDFEYRGSPKKEHFGVMIFSMLLGCAFFGLTYYYNTKCNALEKGEAVEMFDKLYQIYSVFGKWAVLILFIGMGIGMFYAAYFHYKKYLETKNNNF